MCVLTKTDFQQFSQANQLRPGELAPLSPHPVAFGKTAKFQTDFGPIESVSQNSCITNAFPQASATLVSSQGQ